MAKNLLNKYVWLVETIYKAKRITFEEINEKWLANDLSEGVELALRTFHKWRIAVEENFGLIIECERKGGYHYYIENIDDLKNGSIRNWLLNTISVSNLLIGNQQMKDRILLEDIPSGQEFLPIVIEAIKNMQCISMTYHIFNQDESYTIKVEPYCIKLFKQRWYMMAYNPYNDSIRIYAFDRILDMKVVADEKFKMPQSFSPVDYFKDCYGVIVDDDLDIETVKLKVYAGQANYLRSLPLHYSQQEIQQTGEYSIFELKIRPAYDFIQEILLHGEDVEVLEPLWLRKEVAQKVERMWNKYK